MESTNQDDYQKLLKSLGPIPEGNEDTKTIDDKSRQSII